jgi:RNase P subunit RPR2
MTILQYVVTTIGMTQQKTVTCKNCHRKFLIPAVDTGRQEISGDMVEATFALICPFCMAHALYSVYDLE